MAVLSDLLGIPHFTTSNGSTVRSDFLEAVAERLGVPEPERLREDPLLAACIEAATRASREASLFSPGNTVTDRALQAIINGVVENWTIGPAAGTADADTPPGPPADSPAKEGPVREPDLPTGDAALALPVAELEDLLDPDRLLGPVDRRLLAVAYREGQDSFRKAVLRAYARDQHAACCMRGWGPVQALEAAHIIPHAEGGLGIVSNGLCLRGDVHALFDRQLVAVNEDTLRVLVHPVLGPTPYADLAEVTIHVPSAVVDRPARAALGKRRLDAGL